MRHTTTTHMVRASNDLSSAAYWLGHAYPNTTHIYVEVDMDTKRHMLDETNPAQETGTMHTLHTIAGCT